MNAVELDGATLAYGERIVLDAVSIAVREGEFVGVFGPNGAGKTTLLRAILGLAVPRSGRLRVFGLPAGRGSPAIGYMPQRQRLAENLRLSGEAFLRCTVGGHRWGVPLSGAAAGDEVRRALDRVGATALAARPLAELSGGERQRLLLAQALIGQPRLLLLDEPLVSLDLRYQRDVVALVRQLQQELGLTVLFCAHELNPLLGHIDRVLYLGSGQAALGTVDAVVTAPILSLLYGMPVDIVRLGGRIFVLSGEVDLQHIEHRRHAAV